jgi:hypothetical protein
VSGIFPSQPSNPRVDSSHHPTRPGLIGPSSRSQELDLKRPIYSKTASFGHFGRNDPDFTWETPKKLVY